MLALKQFRSKVAGLPDLLNYAALVDEGIVQGKDGSLMAGYFFRGDDAGSASDSERNYVTAQVNSYLARFGNGWCMWVDSVRLPSPGYPTPSQSHFPDPISAMIDAERREMFERQDTHYESEYALVLQFMPPLKKEETVKKMFYNVEGGDIAAPGDQFLANFKKKLVDFHNGLGDLLNMRRMATITAGKEGDPYQSDELVNYLHFTLTGETIALRIPDCPMYLDSWLGIPPLWPGDLPKLGERYISCVAIDGFPAASYPGILSLFEGLPVAYRWSSRFMFLEQQQALAALGSYHRKWTQKIRAFLPQLMKSNKGVINTDAVSMAHQIERAMGDANSDLVRYGYYTPVVVLMSEDRKLLEDQARYMRREIERRGFSARIESVNALEAWLGSLPGHAFPNVRRPLIHTLNLADLLPLAGIWPGLRENPCGFYPDNSPPLMHTITTGSTPFRFHLHVGDVGHILIFGPTSAGKSTLIATIIVQFRRYRSRPRPDGSTPPGTVTAFDKGRSLYALCKAVGGQHYDIGSDAEEGVKGLSLCPLADIDSDSDVLWAQEWIATCYQLQSNKPLMPEQKNEVHRAITLLRDKTRKERSLSYFVSTVQDEDIRVALKHYVVNGGMGHLLDGEEDSLKDSIFIVYEIDELMKLGEQNCIPVLLYLFRRFEKSLTGQPAILSLDEAWVMLGHPVFREKVREWLKELRKKNCAVIIATQSLSDAARSGLMDVLIEQCQTKIFLPNNEAPLEGTKDYPGPSDLYRTFGMNQREILMLQNMQYKKHYYYKSPLGRRVFELGLGPLALSFVAVSDKDTLREVVAFEGMHGADWPLRWLERRGVDYAKHIN